LNEAPVDEELSEWAPEWSEPIDEEALAQADQEHLKQKRIQQHRRQRTPFKLNDEIVGIDDVLKNHPDYPV